MSKHIPHVCTYAFFGIEQTRRRCIHCNALEYGDALEAQASAVKTLEQMGYTNAGGEYWKPPIGKAPDFNLIDALRDQVEAQASEIERLNHKDKLITKWTEKGELIERLYSAGLEQERELSALKAELAALKAQPTEPAPKGLFIDLIAAEGPEFVAEMAALNLPDDFEPRDCSYPTCGCRDEGDAPCRADDYNDRAALLMRALQNLFDAAMSARVVVTVERHSNTDGTAYYKVDTRPMREDYRNA
jgi:hypothetical protein